MRNATSRRGRDAVRGRHHVYLQLACPTPGQAALAGLCPFRRPCTADLAVSTYIIQTACQGKPSESRDAIEVTAHIEYSSSSPCEPSSPAALGT